MSRNINTFSLRNFEVGGYEELVKDVIIIFFSLITKIMEFDLDIDHEISEHPFDPMQRDTEPTANPKAKRG